MRQHVAEGIMISLYPEYPLRRGCNQQQANFCNQQQARQRLKLWSTRAAAHPGGRAGGTGLGAMHSSKTPI